MAEDDMMPSGWGRQPRSEILCCDCEVLERGVDQGHEEVERHVHFSLLRVQVRMRDSRPTGLLSVLPAV